MTTPRIALPDFAYEFTDATRTLGHTMRVRKSHIYEDFYHDELGVGEENEREADALIEGNITLHNTDTPVPFAASLRIVYSEYNRPHVTVNGVFIGSDDDLERVDVDVSNDNVSHVVFVVVQAITGAAQAYHYINIPNDLTKDALHAAFTATARLAGHRIAIDRVHLHKDTADRTDRTPMITVEGRFLTRGDVGTTFTVTLDAEYNDSNTHQSLVTIHTITVQRDSDDDAVIVYDSSDGSLTLPRVHAVQYAMWAIIAKIAE